MRVSFLCFSFCTACSFSVPFQSTWFAMHQKFNGHALHQTLLSSPAVAATGTSYLPPSPTLPSPLYLSCTPCRPSAVGWLEMQPRLHSAHIFLITILMRRVLCYTKLKNRIAPTPTHTLVHTHSQSHNGGYNYVALPISRHWCGL